MCFLKIVVSWYMQCYVLFNIIICDFHMDLYSDFEPLLCYWACMYEELWTTGDKIWNEVPQNNRILGLKE